jgi:hypothetical protein
MLGFPDIAEGKTMPTSAAIHPSANSVVTAAVIVVLVIYVVGNRWKDQCLRNGQLVTAIRKAGTPAAEEMLRAHLGELFPGTDSDGSLKLLMAIFDRARAEEKKFQYVACRESLRKALGAAGDQSVGLHAYTHWLCAERTMWCARRRLVVRFRDDRMITRMVVACVITWRPWRVLGRLIVSDVEIKPPKEREIAAWT